MKIDENIRAFFSICKLNWENFSFEELVERYKLVLSLIKDDYSEYYMDMNLLEFWVNTFSKILNQFMGIIQDDNVVAHVCKRMLEIKNKSEDEYTTNDMVGCFSMIIVDEYFKSHMKLLDFVYVKTIFNTMFENFYYVDKFCESVDKKIGDVQKGLGLCLLKINVLGC